MDFFQDWASARNLLEGKLPYGSISDAAQDYLGNQGTAEAGIPSNAHPPTSILLVVPLARLDYPDAMLVWNLVSFAFLAIATALMLMGLGLRLPPLAIVPAVALLLISPPFRIQINQGQVNFVLLMVLVGAWYAHRTGKPLLAGALVGTAAAIKLFPGLLLVHYALRRNWKVVIAGVSTLIVLMAVTAAIMSLETVQDYFTRVIPTVESFRGRWRNVSAHGFWWKLLAPGLGVLEIIRASPELTRVQIDPPIRSATIASATSLISVVIVLVVWVRLIVRGQGRNSEDLTFGATLVVMLLVSPVTWLHYLVLLLPAFVITWSQLSSSRAERYAWLLLLLLVLGPVWDLINPAGSPRTFGWLGVVTVLAIPTWGMIGLLLFLRFKLRTPSDIRGS